MKASPKAQWSEGLRQHLHARQLVDPILSRQSLSILQEQQCRILGGHLIGWLKEWGPMLIQERNIVSRGLPLDKDPVIVIATDDPGLVAASQIIGPPKDTLVYGRLGHVRDYDTIAPDREFAYHCELASYFEEVEEKHARALRKQHGLKPRSHLCAHYECSTLGPLFARGARHLWTFQDNTLSLVAEAFERWIS